MNFRAGLSAMLLGSAAIGLSACETLITKPTLYGTVRAEVLRRDGTPIPGSELQLYTGQRPMGYAASNAQGTFTFVDVPEGLYGVRAVPPTGYVSAESIVGGTDAGFRDGLIIEAGKQANAQFTFLKIGMGSVVARVRDPNNQPVPNIPLTLYTSAGKFAEGVTNQSGTFTFAQVPLGNYGIFASRPVQYLDSAESSLPSRDGLLIDEGFTGSADFVFALCAGSIDVRVRDNTGAAVPGTLLTLYGTGGVRDTTLGADGRKQYQNLQCGPYGVRLLPPPGWTAVEGLGATFQDKLSIHRGTALDVTLTVTRIGRGAVRVRVLDDAEGTLENIRVVLYTGAGVVQDVLTGPDGFVTMPNNLVNTDYGLRVVPRAGYTVKEGVGISFFDGIRLSDGTTRDFVFRLKRD